MSTEVIPIEEAPARVPIPLKRIAIAIGIIFVIIIALFVIFKIRGKVNEWKERKKIHYVTGGGEVAADFDAAGYANKMFDVMDGVWTLADTKGAAAEELMGLNDNQLIAIHNYWNDHLYDRYGETMYKMMKNEWNVPEFTFGGTNYWTGLLDRLSRLGLISK